MTTKAASHVAIAAGIGVLALIGTVMPQKAAGEKPTDVSIVNPVPLPVSAQQNGTWNVNVLGTPTFNLAAPGSAIPVRNIDEPGRAPYQSHVRNPSPGGLLTPYFSTVPAGKRLVIEHFSYLGVAPGACLPISFDPQGFLGADTTSTWLLPSAIGVSGAQTQCAVNVAIRAYVDGGQSPGVLVPANLGLFDMTLSGYLVDCTAPNSCAAIVQ